jgi:hypothetical protein
MVSLSVKRRQRKCVGRFEIGARFARTRSLEQRITGARETSPESVWDSKLF